MNAKQIKTNLLSSQVEPMVWMQRSWGLRFAMTIPYMYASHQVLESKRQQRTIFDSSNFTGIFRSRNKFNVLLRVVSKTNKF